MALEAFVKKLEEELLGEGSFATEVPGVFAIPLDEGVTLLISNLAAGGISLKARVCPLPGEPLEPYFEELLLSNHFLNSSRGVIVGIDENATHLTLSQEIDYDINFKDFRDIVEDFINSIDFWIEETETYRK